MKNREKCVPLAAALFVCAGLQVRAFIHNLKSLLSGESLSDIPFMPDIVLPTSVYVKLMILCALEFAVLVLFAVFFLNMRRRTLYRAALIAGAVVNTFMFFAAPIYSYPVLALLCVFLFIDSLLSHKLLTASRIACIASTRLYVSHCAFGSAIRHYWRLSRNVCISYKLAYRHLGSAADRSSLFSYDVLLCAWQNGKKYGNRALTAVVFAKQCLRVLQNQLRRAKI